MQVAQAKASASTAAGPGASSSLPYIPTARPEQAAGDGQGGLGRTWQGQRGAGRPLGRPGSPPALPTCQGPRQPPALCTLSPTTRPLQGMGQRPRGPSSCHSVTPVLSSPPADVSSAGEAAAVEGSRRRSAPAGVLGREEATRPAVRGPTAPAQGLRVDTLRPPWAKGQAGCAPHDHPGGHSSI